MVNLLKNRTSRLFIALMAFVVGFVSVKKTRVIISLSRFFVYKNRKKLESLGLTLLLFAGMYELLAYSLTVVESNWAGYAAVSNTTTPRPVVSAVYGSWIVQNTTGYTSSLAAQWVGVGGVKNYQNDNSLIQIGTEYLPTNNMWGYVGWYELLPALPVQIPRNILNVSVGDVIFGSIRKSDSSMFSNTWVMSINDLSNGQTFSKSVDYNSSRLTADWVEESGTLGSHLVSLANFKTAYFGAKYTGINLTNYATMDNRTMPMGSFQLVPFNSLANGGFTAIVSPLSPDNKSFGVVFQSSQGDVKQIRQVFYLSFILLFCSAALLLSSLLMSLTKKNILTYENKERANLYVTWGSAYGYNLKQAKEFLKRSLDNEVKRLAESDNGALARDFFKSAQKDISAAHWLYLFRNYGLAVFHLQQGVEKTTKAVLLLHRITLRKSHNAIEMYETWYNDIFQDTQMKARRGRTDFKTYNTRIIISALTRTTQLLIAAVDKPYRQRPELFSALFGSDRFRWKVNTVNKHLTDYFSDDARSSRMRELTKQEITGLMSSVAHINNLDMAVELVPLFQELQESMEALCALSILTAAHEQTSRYPNSVIYNKKLGIVKMLPVLLDKTKHINELWLSIIIKGKTKNGIKKISPKLSVWINNLMGRSQK